MRTLEQIRDEILQKLEQLKRHMIDASSGPHGGSGRPRGVQIDSKAKGAAWLTWGQRYVVDAEYVLPQLWSLFAELGLHGVPNLPQWTREPQTEFEALTHLNALLACCDAPQSTPTVTPLVESTVTVEAENEVPWQSNPAWQDLRPQAKRILRFMHDKEFATVGDFAEEIWGDSDGDNRGKIGAALYRANSDLHQLGDRRTLVRPRGESVVRWE
jgi:hypothetical protein